VEAETMKIMRPSFILRFSILSICLLTSALPTWAESLEELNKALQGNDVEAAWKAVEGIPQKIAPQQREEAIKILTRGLKKEWVRCAGDIRQSIANQLAALNAKEAIPDLLGLISEKKNIDHECSE
jgi:HEAT repeat protein